MIMSGLLMEVYSLDAHIRMATLEGAVKALAYTDNNITLCQQFLCGVLAGQVQLG